MEEKKEEHKEHIIHTSAKKINLYYTFNGLVLLLGIILIINIMLTYSINQNMKKNIDIAKEKLKPARIELTVIKNSKCSDCFDVSSILSHIKSAQVNITKENVLEFDSQEGKDMIRKFNIEKIPNLVITGEIDKINIPGLQNQSDALLLQSVTPPYTSAETGLVKGRVTLYNLQDSACTKCADLKLLVSQIKGAGVKITEEKYIDVRSDEGKSIIGKYNLDFAPTILLSKDAEAYPIVQQVWSQIGTKENDGSYVLRTVNPPYVNLTTNTLRGLVDIRYLVDKSCTECYNVSLHKEILTSPQTFAIKLEKEETIDVGDNQGKELIAKYNITQVPTVILSNEVKVYPSSQGLVQLFSNEIDGSYVFRKASVLGAYKDLITNQIVLPQKQNQEQ